LIREIGEDTSIESEVNDSEASVSDTGIQNLSVEASSSSSVSSVENDHGGQDEPLALEILKFLSLEVCVHVVEGVQVVEDEVVVTEGGSLIISTS